MAAAAQLSEQTVVCPARQRRRARRLGVRSCSHLRTGRLHVLVTRGLWLWERSTPFPPKLWEAWMKAGGTVWPTDLSVAQPETLHIFLRDEKQMDAEAMPTRRCLGMSDSGVCGRRGCSCFSPVGAGTARGWGGSFVRSDRGSGARPVMVRTGPSAIRPSAIAHALISDLLSKLEEGAGCMLRVYVQCGPFRCVGLRQSFLL